MTVRSSRCWSWLLLTQFLSAASRCRHPGTDGGVLPVIGTDGVVEVGRYIDFHNSDADATDNANRLETNGGTVGLFETPSGGVLKRIVSAINSTLAQGDILYYDGTNFVRLAPGTSDHRA